MPTLTPHQHCSVFPGAGWVREEWIGHPHRAGRGTRQASQFIVACESLAALRELGGEPGERVGITGSAQLTLGDWAPFPGKGPAHFRERTVSLHCEC